jgi:cytochrome P450/NADPH-cytochrome P450 reductase
LIFFFFFFAAGRERRRKTTTADPTTTNRARSPLLLLSSLKPTKPLTTPNRVAGHETTAGTLGFTLAYLSANPDCEKKVLEELDRVLGVDLPSPAAAPGSATANPPKTTRAIREPTAADIGKLPYLEACFREALRLHPAVVAINRDAARDTVLLGRYRVARGQRVAVNLPAMHRHEAFWEGEGLKPATEYDPERFMPPHVGKRHPNAFAGFGFGSRACIGSAFALLEAKTFLAVLLPRFSIKAVGKGTRSDPAPPFPYPPPASLADGGAAPTAHGLRLRVSPRPGFVAAPPPPPANEATTAAPTAAAAPAALAGGVNLRASGTPVASPRPSIGGAVAPGNGPAPSASSAADQPIPFHVLFGSNSGTCEALASRVAEVAAASGFSPVRLTALDAVHSAIKADGGAASLPPRAAVAVVCSTYNGTPPDNARAFLQWVQKGAAASSGADGAASAAADNTNTKNNNNNNRIPPGIGFCVVGLGNSQWAATYQKVPRQLDEALGAYGATRVRAFRAVDVNEPDFQDAFEAWLGTLGAEMRVHFGLEEAGGAGGKAAGGLDGQGIAPSSASAGGAAAASAPAGPPTLASLSPAPRFKLELVEGVTASTPNANDAIQAKALEPLCTDIAAVCRALIAGRRRLAANGAPAKPVVGTDPYHLLRVLKNDELQLSGSDRSTRHVEIELPGLNDLERCGSIAAAGDGSGRDQQDPSCYEAGDHLEVLACNAPALVDAALRALRLSGDEIVVWTPASGRSARGVGALDATAGGGGAAADDASALAPRPLSVTTTARMVLAWVADLGAPPSRRVVEALIATVACPPERRAAHEKYASDQGYKQNVLSARLTVPELLSAPELRSAPPPPLDALLLALPRVAPRYYSISSSPLASEGKPRRTCSITVGLVRFNTGTGRVHEGAASSLVHRTRAVGADADALAASGVLIGTVRRLQSTFRLPADPTAPIIMIGPGTGVAPMMGFLQEREVLLKTKNTTLGAAHLFFGCRSDGDFIYKERLEEYSKNGVLSGLHVAFSRKEGVPKTYVQDLIEENGAELWRLLTSRPDGKVYVCGDARRMAPDVKAAFRDLAVRHGGRSQAAADAWIGAMLEGARYLEDVWAGN